MNWLHRTLAGAAVVVAAAAPAFADLAAGTAAPDFGGTWLNHESTTLSALKGHVVLVEFMATW